MNRGEEGRESPLAHRPGLGRLTGRSAVVVGGGASGPGVGNGRATAIVLAREGASVTVVDVDAPAARDTVEHIVAEGGTAMACVADATSAVDCQLVVERTREAYGRLDALVNSVGVMGPPGSIVDIDPADWDAVLRVNLRPIVMMSRYALPVMTPGGSIVNVSSIGALRETDRPAYATAKAGVIGLTLTMAGQHGRAGIRVNAVCPGQVWTPMVTASRPPGTALDQLREAWRVANLLRIEGTGWDTAYAILFLVSDEARWITGQAIVVDGGLTTSYRLRA